jgi:serine/threonine-protein kinase RsbW
VSVDGRYALASRLEAIDDARRWAAGHARAAGLDDEETWALELALTEALANVVRHAYAGRPDGRIELGLHVDDDRTELTIRDWGTAFDPSTYDVPDLATPRAGGYGLHLMRELVDEIVADVSGEGTLLRLVTHRKGARR